MLIDFYPSREPYNSEMLKVSDLHTLYIEEVGNPEGMPIVFIHGGPGGGIDPDHRRFFDPDFFRIILFDQRGSGKSTPFAEINQNTTWDLVQDMEKIRKHLNIDSWILFGGSWGSTLALCYAISYPQYVKHMILRGIFLCREEELLWFYQEGANWIFPDAWKAYWNFIPESERKDMISAYYKRLTSNNQVEKIEAARIWSTWEAACSKLYPDDQFCQSYQDPQKALPFARIECHYFINKAFLPNNNFILDNIYKVKHITTDIVQGRYDIVCPIKSAWELSQKLTDAKLWVVPDAGHSAFEPGIRSQLISCCDKVKSMNLR